MPKAEQTVEIAAPIEKVFDVIVDYERYPEFLPEMKQAGLLSRQDGVALVSFELEIIMRLGYTLRLVEDRPNQVTWSLDRAKMMAANNGCWRLESLDANRTRATYAIELKLNGLIPKSVSTRLAGITLPDTLQRFKDRAESKAQCIPPNGAT